MNHVQSAKKKSSRDAIVGPLDLQSLFGGIRLVLAIYMIVRIGYIAAVGFDHINVAEIAQNLEASIWFLRIANQKVIDLLAMIVNTGTLRFMLAPAFTTLFVFATAGFFVKDVYALRSYRDAMHYVIASMFGIRYGQLLIEKGVKKLDSKKTNLLEAIGGPGFVIIEPGSAAMFSNWMDLSRVGLGGTYFLDRFESVAQTMTLDDQQGDKDEISAMTRDGIQVVLKDIHFRYRMMQVETDEGPVVRSLENPYPFDNEAMKNVAFNVTVLKDSVESWNATVERMVIGDLTDFIAKNTIDHLTAPATDGTNPRFDLRNSLLTSLRAKLASVGAELLWIDAGHIHIVADEVDSKRTNFWAAEWVGDANVTRAYGEATRMAYQELGRAEAQAELIIGITDALKDSLEGSDSPSNLRKLLLARTAQIIDAMNKDSLIGSNGHNGKA